MSLENLYEGVSQFDGFNECQLYDDNTKDSGFSDSVSNFRDLIHSPLLLDHDAETLMCFSPSEDKEIPTRCWSAKRTREGSSTESTPSQGTTLALKRLKLFDRENDENVKKCVEKSSDDQDLIGDFSKACCLPVMSGDHPDLKTISVETMRNLITGVYDRALSSYRVIDSRYPYEFAGGHIRGAVNIHTKEECQKLLEEPRKSKEERHVLIFHCEFSKERGPNMYRHLRQMDRLKNGENYPELCHPEVYILDGGYKRFFERHSDLCEPSAYKPMLHPEHEQDLRHFRKKSRTGEREMRSKKVIRRNLSQDY
ncbi:cdc25-like protein phosphatase twine [Cylas formicarius]|uniref:cdc25-like protein phosphatase twine n=1 Tax=Cylas formicarius TaxID=197179 RepID=UPI0029588DC9|nr:cdc25-like protein phosphatase twine [Cylas formicarius]